MTITAPGDGVSFIYRRGQFAFGDVLNFFIESEHHVGASIATALPLRRTSAVWASAITTIFSLLPRI